MEYSKKSIVNDCFTLGEGATGIYSDLSIAISQSEKSSLKRCSEIEMEDELTLNLIELEFRSWIDSYQTKQCYLEICILNVRIDKSGRKFAVKNAVAGIMHKALPKIGVKPPQIFGC